MGKKKEKNNDEEDKKDKEQKEKKSKTTNKKDNNPEIKDVTPVVKIVDKKAIVDQYFPDRNLYHIYQDDGNDFNGKLFSCTLNKCNLDKNNNKFYIIQLLEHDTYKSLVLFTRWGRVGVAGMHDQKDVDTSSGPKLFMKKYKHKIGVGYQEIFIDYEAEIKKEDLPKEKKNDNNKVKKKFVNTLNEDVMDLIRLIYNKKMINDNLHEIGYDSKKMPLGKLSPVTLTNGLNILKQIVSELNNPVPDGEKLKNFSSEFYTQIPHDFGFKKISNYIIDTNEKVKEKVNMINILSDMKITLKILEMLKKKKKRNMKIKKKNN